MVSVANLRKRVDRLRSARIGDPVTILAWHGVVLASQAETMAEAQRRRRPVYLIDYTGNVDPELL